MAARSDAARAGVEAARADVLEEVVRLEAVARSSLDVGSRVREDPVRAVAITGAAIFMVTGGPFRLYRLIARTIRRIVFGPPPEFPPSMLPDEVERTLRRMGAEGETVRGTLEREFASYLAERGSFRKTSVVDASGDILGSLLKPAARVVGLRLAREMATANPKTYETRLEAARERWLADLAKARKSSDEEGDAAAER
jgi:hypothetical protein